MLNTIKIGVPTALVLLLWPGSADADAKGLEIATKAAKANEGFRGERSEVEMVLFDAYGETTTRSMSNIIFEVGDDGDKSKIEFLWPPDVKGTRMLTWSHKDDSDDQWLFLPKIKRVKRISSNNKSGSFMGSEFSYEDLASQEVEKYTHRFLREEQLDGRDCWVTERVPTDQSSGYSRQVVWTDKGYMNPAKIEYYDRKGELLKVGTFLGYAKVNGLWRVERIEMKNVQTKKSSTLTWKTRELQVDLHEDDFDSDNLDV